MFRQKALAFLLFVAGSFSVLAQTVTAPNPPSNLRVKVLGANAFLMEWKDNSDNEVGWEIRISLGKTDNPAHYNFIAAPDITSYTVITNDVPGKTLSFQLAAYNGDPGVPKTDPNAVKLSDTTSSVTVVALAPANFGAPTNMRATTLDDGAVGLDWDDNSTTEGGYLVEIKTETGDWLVYNNTNPGASFHLPVEGLAPSTKYFFRTRAYKENPTRYTQYSDEVSATTKAFQAPTDLVAKAEGDGGISLKWKDRSSLEMGYEIEFKSGTADFAALGTADPNTTSSGTITDFDFDTEYKFRIRSVRLVGEDNHKEYSNFSNVATVTTGYLAKPTGFTGEVIDDSSVHLVWKDASGRETGYEVLMRQAGDKDFKTLATLDNNSKEYTATELRPGTSYDFKVRANDLTANASSSFTGTIRLTTKDGFSSDLNPPIFWNTSFFHQIEVSRPGKLSSLEVTNLPPGLSFDSSKRSIKGATKTEGVRKVGMKATYADGKSLYRQLVLRIIRPPAPPVAKGSFGAVTVAAGTAVNASLVGKFADPDTGDARHVSTSKGGFDIILYPLATPLTVANFLKYADHGKYVNTIVHRSIADFVIQTGGYRYSASNGYGVVKPLAAVKNEPGISNVKGTLAMAKIGGDPNSATCEYFVNVSDSNAPNLDYQNGGFTVFGRVAGNGMNVINPINSLPVGNYSVPIDGTERSLSDVPVDADSAPATLDPSQLVKIKSVTNVPLLKYEVSSEDGAVATAKLVGTDVVITGVAAGSTRIQVKAIDLDGQSLTRKIAVKVN